MTKSSELLPDTAALNISALSRVFDDTTTSYKYLFFAALLVEFLDSGFSNRQHSLRQLSIGMLTLAWYPIRVYLLSFGARDQINDVLTQIKWDEAGPIPHKQLKAVLEIQSFDYLSILRWVPYRTLGPFFARELRGISDSRKNALIRKLANANFDSARPLYRFVGTDTIELHPDWAVYISRNFPIISAWVERHWIAYLQARNPTVPAISKKIAPPLRRAPLSAQTDYWKKVYNAVAEPLTCLYSGRPLDSSSFHLDHFLPWTFVCHDALWNLIPVSPEANSAKRNRLPDASYIPEFVIMQHKALTVAATIMSAREWEIVSAVFIEDLRIPRAGLLQFPVLQGVYERSLAAQLAIAGGIGFEGGWTIRKME